MFLVKIAVSETEEKKNKNEPREKNFIQNWAIC